MPNTHLYSMPNTQLCSMSNTQLCSIPDTHVGHMLNMHQVVRLTRTKSHAFSPFLTGRMFVRRTWFGQFEEFTCSQLACNEMQASARTCGRRAADSMIENVG